MPFYQAPDQSLHQIDPAFAHMLPVGSVPISDEAAQAILDAIQAAPSIPEVVTMRQARLALLSAGLLVEVEAAIDALVSPQKDAARIQWEYAQEVRRADPLVQMLAPALDLSDAELDALFTTAAGL
jgi:hypothetical protein